jgi:hypothetical protein
MGIPVFPLHTPKPDGSCSCGRKDCTNVGKHPRTTNGVKDATTDKAQIEKWWTENPDANIALATGTPSAPIDVLDVDCDHERGKFGDESLKQLEDKHGQLPETWICLTGGGGLHYYFYCNDPSLKNSVNLRPGLDIRAAGGYVVAPPSLHKSGRRYEWEANYDPEDEPFPAFMPDWLHDLISKGRTTNGSETPYEVPETVKDGGRNDAMFKMASSLRAKGLTTEEIEAAVLKANEKRCDPPLPENEVKTICGSVGKYERGTISPPVRESDEWDKPIPFDTIQTPDFPTECLPPPVAAFVEALAESTQTPPEMAAVLSLGVLATALQSKFDLEVTSDWKEPLCLYTVANAPPGERKSAVIGALTKPVYSYEAERREAEAIEIRQNQDERSMLEQRLEAAKKAAAKAKGDNALAAREEALEISAELAEFKDMHPFRALVDDTTPEKLVDIMDTQDGCITVSSAEGGLFDSMSGRYDKSSNFDVYLKGHAGDPITVDRIGRKPNYVKEPRLTMMLTIQPEVVNGLMNNATLRGRGLCGRFLYVKCKSKVSRRNVNPPPIPNEVKYQYNLFVKDILSSQYKGTIRLSEEAQKLRIQYAETVEQRLGDTLEHMRDWGGKAVGAMLRIAALIHASEVKVNPAEVNISAETVAAAIKIMEVLCVHAMATYQDMGEDGTFEDAKYLLRRINESGQDEISKRDLWHICKGKFKKVEAMEPALQTLIDMGYVREIEQKTGGRPTRKLIVNPLTKSTNSTKRVS